MSAQTLHTYPKRYATITILLTHSLTPYLKVHFYWLIIECFIWRLITKNCKVFSSVRHYNLKYILNFKKGNTQIITAPICLKNLLVNLHEVNKMNYNSLQERLSLKFLQPTTYKS